jgi:predicted MPP superfamily phosphohydrolase
MPSAHMSKRLILLHLSDIHFNKGSGTTFDLDTDLRNELEKDAQSMSKLLGGVDAILISGDVVFAGLSDEYEKAADWLETLCEKVGCSVGAVWPTPGNHDIHRPTIESEPLLQDIQHNLRTIDVSDIDDTIKTYFMDKTAASLLLKPVESYNRFASRYECEITPHKFFWQHDLKLNDGSTLRLHGLSSSLISNKLDNDIDQKLILSSYQVKFEREPGVEHLSLCHHPPDWLRDRETIESKFHKRVRIQLFGHKHAQVISEINGSVRIISGATHPDRREKKWLPRYNILSLHVNNHGETRELILDIYPRVWCEDNEFRADYYKGAEVRTCSFSLEPWVKGTEESACATHNGAEMAGLTSGETEDPLDAEQTMSHQRKLTYRFLGLPYSKRLEISIKLGLIHDEDMDLQDIELFRQVFRRAVESKNIASLWDAVEQAYGAEERGENPFLDERNKEG